MNEEELIRRLVTEFNYPHKGAVLVARKLMSCTPDLLSAFERWWNAGEMPPIELEGFTIERLIKEHNMNPIAAFLTLDFLQREPQKAIITLRKGHDHIKLPEL